MVENPLALVEERGGSIRSIEGGVNAIESGVNAINAINSINSINPLAFVEERGTGNSTFPPTFPAVPEGDTPVVVAVREVFIIHVGGTRCVTSSTDHIMKIHAGITWTVECIRGCIFLFLLEV